MEEQVIVKKYRPDSGSLNVKELFFKYLKFLPLYLIFIALALVGAYIYLRYATEYYQSTGQIVIRDEKSSGGVRDDRLDVLMQSDSRKNVQTEIEIIQSRQVMQRVVENLNLNFNYIAKGRFKELNVYKTAPFEIEALAIRDSSVSFLLNLVFTSDNSFTVNGSSQQFTYGQVFKNEFGQFKLVRRENSEPNPEYNVSWLPTFRQASVLLSGLAVAPKQNTGILTISMETTNPILAADVVNGLMEEYKLLTIEDKNASTKKSLDFIDANLRERELELDSIKRVYVAYQKAHNIIDPSTQSANYFSRVEDALKLEQQQRLQLNNATQIQDYLRNSSNNQSTVPSSLGIEDPTLNNLVASYNKAQIERKELLENAPAGNVIVQQKNDEVRLLREKILENVSNIRSSYAAAIGTLRQSNSQALSQLSTLPNKRQDLINIQQQLESKAVIFNNLLTKREESAITLASTISNTKVLQEAMPNNWPVKPNRRNIKLVAFLLGLIVPTGFIVIRELLNDKVNSKADVERLTNASILGEVGHSKTENTLVVTQGNRKVIAEQFRILRSNLQYILPGIQKPVILVTSSFSGEGKSFVSTNIGAVMGLANKKTIILELDIRKPKILSGLGLPKHPGITNYILGKVSLEDLPVKVPGSENLYVLPCGPIPPNPAELLLDTKVSEMFEYLRKHFDAIIVDTAPVGMVSDALTLSKFADCTLYLVRQGHTFKKQVTMIDGYYREQKLPKVSIVLNDVTVQPGSGYGYGGYGYGYGSGYFEEEERPGTGFGRWLGWLGLKNGLAKKSREKRVK